MRVRWKLILPILLIGISCGSQPFTLNDAAFIQQAPASSALTGPIPDIAWWKCDEGIGTSLADSTGNGHTGTLSGTSIPTWTTGPGGVGNALAFNGTTAYVSCGTLSALAGATHATITGWVWRASTSDSVQFGVSGLTSGFYRFNIVWFTDSHIYNEVENSATTGSFPNYVQSLSGWHFVALAYDGTQSSLARAVTYFDGGVQTLTAGSADPAAALPSGVNQSDFELARNLTLGPATSFSGGRIKDVRVYSTTLNSTQIAAIFADGAQ